MAPFAQCSESWKPESVVSRQATQYDNSNGVSQFRALNTEDGVTMDCWWFSLRPIPQMGQAANRRERSTEGPLLARCRVGLRLTKRHHVWWIKCEWSRAAQRLLVPPLLRTRNSLGETSRKVLHSRGKSVLSTLLSPWPCRAMDIQPSIMEALSLSLAATKEYR